MAEITKSGPERCLMNKPDPNVNKVRWLSRFVNGSDRIRILSLCGWQVVDDPRNHVVNDYGSNPTPPQAQMNGHTRGKTEAKQGVRIKGKRHKNRKR